MVHRGLNVARTIFGPTIPAPLCNGQRMARCGVGKQHGILVLLLHWDGSRHRRRRRRLRLAGVLEGG